MNLIAYLRPGHAQRLNSKSMQSRSAFNKNGCSRITSSNISQTIGSWRSHFTRLLIVAACASFSSFVIDKRFKKFKPFLRKTALMIVSFRSDDDLPNVPNSQHAYLKDSGERPCLPLSVPEKDLSGRFIRAAQNATATTVVTSASTASCSIRFSLRTITSGAKLHQFFQTVVPVYNAPIQIVQIRSRQRRRRAVRAGEVRAE